MSENTIYIVASKVRSFVKDNGECNTSAETVEALSKLVEAVLSKAIANAKAAGRKTVMARDIPTFDNL